jgi:hypothetical protein
LVLCCLFFFSHRQVIHYRFKSFFGITDKKDDEDTDDDKETTYISPKETTSRFYFELTLSLCQEDITKFKEIELTNVYLVLNASSILKDRRVKEENQMKQMKNQTKYV